MSSNRKETCPGCGETKTYNANTWRNIAFGGGLRYGCPACATKADEARRDLYTQRVTLPKECWAIILQEFDKSINTLELRRTQGRHKGRKGLSKEGAEILELLQSDRAKVLKGLGV